MSLRSSMVWKLWRMQDPQSQNRLVSAAMSGELIETGRTIVYVQGNAAEAQHGPATMIESMCFGSTEAI